MGHKLSPNDGEESSDKKNDDSEKLEDIIHSKLKPILDDPELSLSKEKKEKLSNVFGGLIISEIEAFSYSAPYPPPDMLRAYNDAVPNGAERIMAMVEKQSNHRIDLESNVISEQSSQSSRGQIFGFILAIVCLGISTLLSMNGHEVVAGIVGGATIVGLVTVFVTGREQQKKNLSSKDITDDD